MPHYHPSIPFQRFAQAVSSVQAQSHPRWELLIYHDGPLPDRQTRDFLSSLNDRRIRFQATAERHNDWGHSLRDRGINEARGDYIVHMNSDNVLYTHALAILSAYSLWPRKTVATRNPEAPQFTVNPDLLVFGIRMMGCVNMLNQHGHLRYPGMEAELQLVLPGWPPNKYRVDAMQLVARRSLWLAMGGWYDKSEESDGGIIERLTREHGYLVVPEILGEHW